ncbi:MAG: sensor histidine kinase, partial [Solirubrobacteraceae bacterium]
IDALLSLARISRAQLVRSAVDLSAIAGAVLEDLRRGDPERSVDVVVGPELSSHADPKLMRVLLDNLLGNAWKFSARCERARIEVGAAGYGNERIYFVRDNGAGFDPTKADHLFAPFHRLHSEAEFKGTGIGLATVHRIIERHGGRIWADATVGAGATFYFTLRQPP